MGGAIVHYSSRLAIQSDGKVLLVGTSVPEHMVRLNSDGSIDSSFNFRARQFTPIQISLALQADGKIVTAYDNEVFRLNADGSLDAGFASAQVNMISFPSSPPLNFGQVRSIALQSNGNILIAGSFTAINGVSRSGIARLHGDPVVTLTSVQRRIDGVIQLGLNASPGMRIVLQASDDLITWFPIRTNIASSQPLEIQDKEAVDRQQRFYRAVIQP